MRSFACSKVLYTAFMDPVKSLEQIAEAMGAEPEEKVKKSDGYRAIRVRTEVYEELAEWRKMCGDCSLSEVLGRVLAMARRELKNVVEREQKIRERTRQTP